MGTAATTMNVRTVKTDIAWPEAFAAWVERLPIPAWLFYTLFGAVGVALAVATTAGVSSSLTVWVWVAGAFTPYLLGARHYVTVAARRSARRFRPLLAVSDQRFAAIEHDLTTTSSRSAWVATLIGAAAGAAVALAVYAFFRELLAQVGLPADRFATTALPANTLTYAVAAPFLLRTERQLRLIQELHATAPVIDPLRSGPVSAFSTLTMRISLVIFIPLYAWLAGSLELIANAPIAFVPILVGNIAAASVFVVPLLGLHARLEAARSAQLDAVGERLEDVVATLSKRIERGDLGDVAPLQQSIMGLTLMRDTLLKVQTWPWRPGTFTTLVTVFGAPILIYLLTRFSSRFL